VEDCRLQGGPPSTREPTHTSKHARRPRLLLRGESGLAMESPIRWVDLPRFNDKSALVLYTSRLKDALNQNINAGTTLTTRLGTKCSPDRRAELLQGGR